MFLKTIVFSIVLGVLMPVAYFMGYKDGHREVEAVKARHEQADKDAQESVKKLVENLKADCQARVDDVLNNIHGES